jgi:hypothetical protein
MPGQKVIQSVAQFHRVASGRGLREGVTHDALLELELFDLSAMEDPGVHGVHNGRHCKCRQQAL